MRRILGVLTIALLGFPNIKGALLGSPTIGIVEHGALCWGPSILEP